MIELERDESQDIQVWADSDSSHVIVEEDGQYWVRDENGDVGVANDLTTALELAQAEWVEVTLAPANRLRHDIEIGRADEVGDYLLQYLAHYGTAGIDAQALARRVYERIEEG